MAHAFIWRVMKSASSVLHLKPENAGLLGGRPYARLIDKIRVIAGPKRNLVRSRSEMFKYDLPRFHRRSAEQLSSARVQLIRRIRRSVAVKGNALTRAVTNTQRYGGSRLWKTAWRAQVHGNPRERRCWLMGAARRCHCHKCESNCSHTRNALVPCSGEISSGGTEYIVVSHSV